MLFIYPLPNTCYPMPSTTHPPPLSTQSPHHPTTHPNSSFPTLHDYPQLSPTLYSPLSIPHSLFLTFYSPLFIPLSPFPTLHSPNFHSPLFLCVAAPRAENLSPCCLSRKPKYVVVLSLSRSKKIVTCPALYITIGDYGPQHYGILICTW